MKNFYLKLTTVKKCFVLTLFATCLFYSCDSFTEVERPDSQLTTVTVFSDDATADAAMTNIYANLRDQGILTGTPIGISQNLGTYADELNYYGSNTNAAFYFFNNALLPADVYVAEYWNRSYAQIYAANAVLEGVRSSEMLSTQTVSRLEGEALFIRALIHFYLVNLFGDVPYITTTDYRVNSIVHRMPRSAYYEQLIIDLQNAATLLSENYYTSGRTRPNKSAAYALLSRVLLYNGQWAEASNAASAVLNTTGLYGDEMNLSATFLNSSPETIWQLPPALAGAGTNMANTFTILAAPPGSIALAQQLLQKFNDADLRKSAWIDQVTDGTTVWYYASKYKQTVTEASSSEFEIVLRLPEQLLIRSEARAQQGELAGAIEDLDRVRQRAGLPGTVAVSQEAILSEIRDERARELFTEYGHRFLDLKRWNQLDLILSPVKMGWQSTDALLPVPLIELSSNPNLLPQNPGY